MELITITVILKSIPGKEKALLEELVKVAKPSREEKGCIEYNLHESLENESEFVLIEKWKNQEALQLHIESEHYQLYRNNIQALIEGREVYKLKAIL
ncbi:putative quinol monooxygenase [Jeotgalibacillus malaysiensis]|uniref:putative quinol monooxygenase n=1 Tax=Jeotgalibacillus malaysiensis TaxID=1508404 RepID=UPI00384E5D45